MDVLVINGAIYKTSDILPPPTNQHPNCFYTLGALSVAQPTVSEGKRIKFHGTAHPISRGSSNLFFDHHQRLLVTSGRRLRSYRQPSDASTSLVS